MASSSCINFLTHFLLLIAFTSLINSTSSSRIPSSKTSTEFIKTSCSTTTYPRLCFSSLSTHASTVQTDPKLLAQTALSVSFDTARSTSTMMIRLSHSQGLNPRQITAMHDCMEELTYSVDQLGKAIREMGQLKASNYGPIMNDIKTWVSAALTDDDTCTDGFSGKGLSEIVRSTVRGRIVNVAHLTSNALALINSYAALHV